VVARQELGESPLWPAAAVVTAASLYATLPSRFIAGPSAGAFGVIRWVVPGLTFVLLAALLLTLPHRRATDRIHITRRVLSLSMIAIISAASGASIVLLVHLLLGGAKAQASLLLRAAIHMWCTNVLLFGLWFWQLDGGGPAARTRSGGNPGDFVFPQQAMPEVCGAGWRPTFVDYLYVSFTNATAFSPTDTMPLTRWAKVLMLVESAASLVLAIMVAARAVNILR
jgi:hypothetical protein